MVFLLYDFFKAHRTVDVELEQGIDALREVQRRYEHILMFINQKTLCLRQVINVQYDLSNCFLELAETDKDLCVNCVLLCFLPFRSLN